MTVEKRAIRGSVAGLVSFALQLLQQLATVPILLGLWGAERYGIWVALLSFYQLLITLDGGHQLFVGAEFLKSYHVDLQRLRRTLSAALTAALGLGALEIGLAVVVVAAGFLDRALGLEAGFDTGAVVASLLLLITTWVACGSVLGVVVRLYGPVGEYARGMWWGTAHRFALFLAPVTAAILGFGILGASVATALVNVTYTCAVWGDALRIFRPLRPFWSSWEPKLAASNVGHSLFLTATGFANQAQQHALLVLTADALGVAAIPAYATVRTVSNVFLQATSIVTGPLTPEIVRLHVTDQPSKLASLTRAIWWITSIPMLAATAVALPFVAQAYEIWTRGRTTLDLGLLAMMIGAVALRSLAAPVMALLQGVNALRTQNAAAIAQAVTVLGIAAPAIPRVGLAGVGVAVLAGELVGSVVVPFVGAFHVDRRAGRAIGFRGVAVAAAPTLALVSTLLVSAGGGIELRWAGLVGLVVAAPALVVGWLELPSDLRARLLRLMRLSRSS